MSGPSRGAGCQACRAESRLGFSPLTGCSPRAGFSPRAPLNVPRRQNLLPALLPLLCLAAALPLHAAIDGTVLNGTTGQPQPGVMMTLIKPTQQGMQNLGTVKTDPQGKFRFDKDAAGGPQLLQTIYKGVIYNQMIAPGMPSSGVSVQVYESTKTPEAAEIAQHMIVIEPTENQIGVSEALIANNKSTTTFANSELGGIRFYLPPAANGQATVSVRAPAGMPVTRSAEKTAEPNVYKVDYPIKPGETEFDITYFLPLSEKFEGRVVGIKGQPAAPVRLVAPAGVTLEGPDLRRLGQEPTSQATIFDVTAKDAFWVAVQGMGSLRGAQETTTQDANDSPQVKQADPAIYRFFWYLLAAGLGSLGVGFAILYRTSPVRQDS
jgi:hypothetical protein